ncbi:acetyl-CoA carboxylase biotin carboxylase subunit [Collinsella ihumii]|uniref:biotin carboxylase n=1 Tax=Collinsella ihumii TaxID=1720204 RepID=A0AAW7JTH1_9ACTN|nr:acetyl-CoA carboxylase biotin carboxylase subunit [Collinsella ihumii]MDN0068926.1 acetyl-CoA carboxylase biotin carboxylase subunit [Collinsella ihumii]
MFKRILIANRGEIAVRVFRACRELDIEPVVVYSEADREALHVQLAEHSYCIGPASSAQSYLNTDAILTVAKAAHCDAIHPGYGFLSENAEFADECEKNGITWIGPSGDVIRMMGNKAAARELMKNAGVPVVPGSDGSVADAAEAKRIADEIGYPVLIKAAAGGGGRGMRKVFDPDQFEDLFEEARAESRACFNDDEMYLEKLVLNPHHIEFQIMADSCGNVVQLGERDCSIQRRGQKMIEETPSRVLTPELRERMGEAAVKAARAAGYVNAGTIEFVLDPSGEFYFIEMNTRIQVEHPITECVTGIDLVREQLRVASGLSLSFTQDDINLRGHAIECRINAEDPAHGFMPSPGFVDFVHLPGGYGVRVDTGLYAGCELPPYYDSLAAKLIVWAPTRLEAIRRMRRCLEEFVIDGPKTNIDVLHQIMYHPGFIRATYNTSFIDENLDTLLAWTNAADVQEEA